MITFQRLNIFLTVCELGSFNKAADRLVLSQAAVSQHIQAFEAAIGNQLFERTSRGVILTKVGKTLETYAQQILPLVAEAEKAVIDVTKLKDQTLQIGATPGLSVYLLPQLLGKFQATYPNINLSIQSSLILESINRIMSYKIDFGFVEGHLTDLDTQKLGLYELTPIHYVLLVPPQHRWAQSAHAIAPQELVQEPFLQRQPTSRSRRWLETALAEIDVEIKNVAAVLDSPGAIKFSLLNQMGVSIVPEYAVRGEIERGELVRIKLRGMEFVRPVKLIWAKDRILSPVQEAFVNQVVSLEHVQSKH
ncbi:MAG: LysR family transcriptional regulator [Chloroflexota bacterium]